MRFWSPVPGSRSQALTPVQGPMAGLMAGLSYPTILRAHIISKTIVLHL
jgi:hypothetical protein